MDRSKNSSRKDGISHKIGDHKHQFRRKDLGGSNLLSRITANRGSLLSHLRVQQYTRTRVINNNSDPGGPGHLNLIFTKYFKWAPSNNIDQVGPGLLNLIFAN